MADLEVDSRSGKEIKLASTIGMSKFYKSFQSLVKDMRTCARGGKIKEQTQLAFIQDKEL